MKILLINVWDAKKKNGGERCIVLNAFMKTKKD